tara:strand:+ start:583 stop:789 length:207 start_codon:yes stop_codon:yes gene_type:complete
MFLTSDMLVLVFFEIIDFALFESNIVIAIQICESLLAAFFPIKAFVFAGFPTTSIFASFLPYLPIALP